MLVVEEDAYGDLRYLPGLAFHPKNHTTYSFLLQKLQSRDDKAKEVERKNSGPTRFPKPHSPGETNRARLKESKAFGDGYTTKYSLMIAITGPEEKNEDSGSYQMNVQAMRGFQREEKEYEADTGYFASEPYFKDMWA